MRSFGIGLWMIWGVCLAQAQNHPILIKGNLYDPLQKQDFLRVIVVNQGSGVGQFGDQDGSFEFACHQQDTVLISVVGYETVRLCMKDSSYKPQYFLKIALRPIEINLPAAQVFPKRELEKIYRDIEKLGYDEHDYKTSGIDAIQSPITFLYESFSRKAQSKRLAIELQNEQRRRDLLKELLAKYVDAEIIALDKREFDVFIDYCKISDFILQNTTQYQFIQIIREKFKSFQRY